MSLTHALAKHLREVYFVGNTTGANVPDVLSGVYWKQAITQIEQLNTIAKLTFYIKYYVVAVLEVCLGKPLTAHDKFSIDVSESL